MIGPIGPPRSFLIDHLHHMTFFWDDRDNFLEAGFRPSSVSQETVNLLTTSSFVIKINTILFLFLIENNSQDLNLFVHFHIFYAFEQQIGATDWSSRHRFIPDQGKTPIIAQLTRANLGFHLHLAMYY